MKQQVKISKVKGNPNNPRIIKNDKFKKLVKSIQEFPEMLKLRPIVVDEDMMVLGGNMRLKAGKDAGLKEVWIEVAEGLTEEQKKEFIVKDNVGFGEWEWDMLANEWDSVQLAEWGLDVWENLDDKEPEAGLIEDDEIPEVKESKVKRGDIWQLGEHRIMCGDSTSSDDVAKLMNGEKADLVFTDPPWNVNYGAVTENNAQGDKPRTILNDKMETTDFKEFMSSSFLNMSVSSKDGCPTYVVMSAQEWGNLMLTLKNNEYHWSSTIVWNKDHLVLSRKDYHTKYEPIWYGWKEGAARLCPLKDRKQSDVWDVKRPIKSPLHPTTKPIELIEIAINNSSIRDSIVLDLFLGSGSTLIAAEKLNRKCYGMELDEKYCDVIIERWEQFTGQKAKKI
jgi:DNA modification methylase